MKFSIVIPVYNAEKYLSQTLQSIRNQTHEDFEVIMVDDGSTDNSAHICETVAKEDNRFILIQKKNAGVSSARNIGIRYAKGEFILFIDSDDWIEKDALTICRQHLQTTHADELIFGMSFDIEKDGKKQRSLNKSHNKQLLQAIDFAPAFKSLYGNNYLTSSCNRMVSLRTLRSNKLLFDEGISNYEDYEFNLRTLGYCKNVMVIPDMLYHYIIRQDNSNSRKYKPNMMMQLPLLCSLLKEDAQRITDDAERLMTICITFQEVLWMGINNICKGPKPIDNIRKLCTQTWIKEKLPMVTTGNKYNDISLWLYKREHWFFLYLWNRFAMLVRKKRY